MHRSGTSVVAHLVNTLGIWLGSGERLKPPNRFNPHGIWEDERIIELNNELLPRLGGTWRSLPDLQAGWERSPRLDELRTHAQALVEENMAGVTRWGWKDPRSCITLPFWRTVLTPTHYVMCLRSPTDVARSLGHTMSRRTAMDLWLTYVQSALAYSEPAARMFVVYDLLMAEPVSQTERLAAFLGQSELEHDGVQRAVRECLVGKLYHHRSRFLDAVCDQQAPVAARALYAALYLQAGAESGAEPGDRLEQLSDETSLATIGRIVETGLSHIDAAASSAVTLRPQVGRSRPTDPANYSLPFVREISPDDEMAVGATPKQYYHLGFTALDCIRAGLRAANVERPPRTVLDFACGYGRVLRMLVAAFPQADFTAADINRDGVQFCASKFGAKGVVAHTLPERIELEDRYELIWVGSLFTHLDAPYWRSFLGLFAEHLERGGVLVFATHGRGTVEELRVGQRKFSVENIPALLAACERHGFAYQSYTGAEGFGISLSRPSWVCAELEQHPGLELVSYTEGGWNGRQDVVVCQAL